MLKAGAVLEGKYRIVRKLGQGGTASVYLAWHETMGVYRAIKEITFTDNAEGEFTRQNLLREIDIMKKIRHPNLPVIYDIIVKKTVLFMVMEYIEGENLKEFVKKNGCVDEKKALLWGKQIGEVLWYLHRQNPPIIYRDLKPSNLMLRRDGQVVLIDFGTAREYVPGEKREDTTCLGTRGYAAPEQYGGKGQTDERTDIYCFGVTLYHLLTGKSPEEPPYHLYPVRYWRKELSPGLEEMILTCVHQNPEERYGDCGQLLHVLRRLESGACFGRKEEKRKIFWRLLTAAAFNFAVAGWCMWKAERIRQFSARTEVRQADRAQDEKNRRRAYKNALLLHPAGTYIYDSLLEYYVRPNDFRPEDAAGIADILGLTGEKKPQPSALETYRRRNPDGYCAFSYGVGIGHFYYRNTIEGKKEAYPWFRDIARMKTRDFSRDKKKRAALYAEISSYYRTFVTKGTDRSGEREGGEYTAFFHTLKKLNRVKIHQNSSASAVAAAYLISLEVAVETGNFAEEFMETGEISAQMLRRELDIIFLEKRKSTAGDRMFWLEQRRKAKEIQDLKALVMEARKKIHMIEEGEAWDRDNNETIT